MKNSKTILFLTIILMSIFLNISCDGTTPIAEIIPKQSADEIFKVDKAFADMSRQVGMRKAFIEFISDEGVLLRPDNLPIVGADAINFLSQVNDSGYVLTWEASGAAIAQSGDLGYAFGTYELKAPDTTIKGTYVNIWKKQPSGAWKFVLNSNNQGTSSGQP